MDVEAIADDLDWWHQAGSVADAAVDKTDPPPENHVAALRELESAGEWGVIVRYFYYLANDLDNRYNAGSDRSYGDAAAVAREAPLLAIYSRALEAAAPRFPSLIDEMSFLGETRAPAVWLERIGQPSGSEIHLRVASQLWDIRQALGIPD